MSFKFFCSFVIMGGQSDNEIECSNQSSEKIENLDDLKAEKTATKRKSEHFCSDCSKVFTREWRLLRHIRQAHTGEVRFERFKIPNAFYFSGLLSALLKIATSLLLVRLILRSI